MCESKLRAYATLNPTHPTARLPADAIDVSVLPDTWTCSCGTTSISLQYLKNGLFHLLRLPPGSERHAASLLPLYQAGQVTALYREYSSLIESNPTEETVQAFVDNHPLLWAFLSPLRIIPKPRLLTHHTADFGILSHHKILYFVELEKPQTTLLTKKEHPHAEVMAAVRQVLDWKAVVQDKRIALLDELGIDPKEVCDIRYLIVAGLAKNASVTGIAKLHSAVPSDAEFLCFDQLGAFLLVIQAGLQSL